MSPLAYQAADGEMIRRILGETGVATKPAAPGVTTYLGAWVGAVVRWVGRFFADRPGLTSGILNAAIIIAILTVALALTLLALSIIRRTRVRKPHGQGTAFPAWAEAPDGAPPLGNRSAWRAKILERLSHGDVAGALEAFWWWLASSLPLDSDIDASWTTRELLIQARRRELLGLGARLDALMYGSRIPSAEDVTACLAHFEETLP